MIRKGRLLSGAFVAIVVSTNALALCGDTSGDGQVSATDALAILNTAVGLTPPLDCSCDACGTSLTSEAALSHCADVNGDASITAVDALMTLGAGVGQPVELSCSCVACEVPTTTSTTTTTIPAGCPPANALDDRTYIEKYSCSESIGGGAPYCADLNASDSLRFNHLGGGEYEVRDVPDTGFVYNGILTCRVFDWDALSPGEYTESGVWTFTNNNLVSFSGSSTYVALDDSYEGGCNGTGAESPNIPPDPPLPPGCP